MGQPGPADEAPAPYVPTPPVAAQLCQGPAVAADAAAATADTANTAATAVAAVAADTVDTAATAPVANKAPVLAAIDPAAAVLATAVDPIWACTSHSSLEQCRMGAMLDGQGMGPKWLRFLRLDIGPSQLCRPMKRLPPTTPLSHSSAVAPWNRWSTRSRFS